LTLEDFEQRLEELEKEKLQALAMLNFWAGKIDECEFFQKSFKEGEELKESIDG